jgi:transposase
MNQISTVTNEGTVRFMTYKGTMNDELFLTFLRRLLNSTTKKILLITDRLRAHDDDRVHNWEEAHKDRIELFYLPKYSPEMNPTEYLNGGLKSRMQSRFEK